MNVSKDKTVRVQVDPIEQNQSTDKLANHFRTELKKRSKIEDIDL